MQEQLISFETAKLAKEKGFKENVWKFYDNGGVLNHSITKVNNNMKLLSAPTQSFFSKWLREVHNIEILIINTKTEGYFYDITFIDKQGNYNDIQSEGYYEIYEDCWEVALSEALKLIPQNYVNIIYTNTRF